MDEKTFRDFLSKRPRYSSKELLEEAVSRSSAEHFQAEAKKKGGHISVAQANALASLLRTQLATSIGLYETKMATKEELLARRIERLPKDFPPDEKD